MHRLSISAMAISAVFLFLTVVSNGSIPCFCNVT